MYVMLFAVQYEWHRILWGKSTTDFAPIMLYTINIFASEYLLFSMVCLVVLLHRNPFIYSKQNQITLIKTSHWSKS
uniref:Uncharacterized protein n=1 Tax=Anguilla anguilla TaxID=7936 RepID=A0A0E9Q2V6_ANGAN